MDRRAPRTLPLILLALLVSANAAWADSPWSGILSRQFSGGGAGSGPSNPNGTEDASLAAQLGLDNLRLWQTFFAGRSSLAGDSASGAQSVVAGVVGTTIGADTQLDDATLVGASFGFSRETFASGSGEGSSDNYGVTLYARYRLPESFYLAGAISGGLHGVQTRRTVDIFGSDILTAHYTAYDFGGRAEAGYDYATGGQSLLSPFIALVGDSYNQPAYGESAIAGASYFAVSYDAKATAVTHGEVGTRFYDYFALDNGGTLSFDTTAAWERELDDNPFVLAAFQTAPDSSFVLRGTRPATDTALLGLGLRLQQDEAWSFGLRSDARLGSGTTIYSGTADVTFRW